MNNGGHSQFFCNPSGRYYKFALAGLHAIGAVQRAKILEEALGLFGPPELPEDDDPRSDRLADLCGESKDPFDDLDERYYDCDENLWLLLSLYAIEHQADFSEADRV